jgi:hypothetical protein
MRVESVSLTGRFATSASIEGEVEILPCPRCPPHPPHPFLP